MLRARTLGEENHRGEVEEGLCPLMAASLKEVRQPPRVAKEVAGPKEEKGEEKGR